MPGFDGTGPMGMGQMTGRGLGYCAVPIGGYGFGRYAMPYAGAYGPAPRPFAALPYGAYPYGMGPYVPRPAGFWGGRGRRPWAQGRFFGRGRGFGRR